MRTVRATRYVVPLREGGSLPAIVEADDDGLYVLKFRGAGQGLKALIAEAIAGEIARALELPVPEIVLVDLDPVLGRSEPDYEIQTLIKRSAGLNLALDYLPGSLAFDAAVAAGVDSTLASRIVWFDAFVSNVDRTARNTNMMVWHRKLYLIDHGAALYFQHNWESHQQAVRSPFGAIRDHVLLRPAAALREADTWGHQRLTDAVLDAVLSQVPDDFLASDRDFTSVPECRAAYRNALGSRLAISESFVTEAIRCRDGLV